MIPLIGKRIRGLREQKNWSQKELESRSGVPQTTISRLENDNSKNGASLNHLQKLAEAFGIALHELLEDEEEPKIA